MIQRLVSALVLTVPFLACGGKAESNAPAAGSTDSQGLPAVAVAKAEEIFSQRCTPCHGASGAGDGAASASLDPKPRNFGDVEWQKSVSDEHIMKIIKVGGAGVGKSPTMPGNPDIINQNVLTALKNKIRAFGSK